MIYPIVIHKDPKTDYGVTVPDLPGCFAAGATIDEAIADARESIQFHAAGLVTDGHEVPAPTSVDHHRKNPDYKDGIWAVVTVDPSMWQGPAKRINITIPQRMLDAIDQYAEQHHESRSGLLSRAASEYIAKHSAA